MPDLDGFELAAMIREHPRFQKMAIIFVSAIQVTDLDLLRGYAAGAVDYVPVPVVPDLLRAKVRVFAELYRKTRQLETLNAELERRVAERTAELAQANSELEHRVEERTREREAALAQVHEMRKVESLGQLTGGVAHDFNSLLMAVLGNLELVRKFLTSDPKIRRLIDGATQGAERGATLTKRMLAFARRQELKPETIDIPNLVESMVEMLGRSLGPGIQITTEFEADVPPTRVDPNQLELALLNLALNARDAMPLGGRLTISAHRERIGAGDIPGLQPGDYVCIAERDTGEGMDEVTRKRATEPFFPTKGAGHDRDRTGKAHPAQMAGAAGHYRHRLCGVARRARSQRAATFEALWPAGSGGRGGAAGRRAAGRRTRRAERCRGLARAKINAPGVPLRGNRRKIVRFRRKHDERGKRQRGRLLYRAASARRPRRAARLHRSLAQPELCPAFRCLGPFRGGIGERWHRARAAHRPANARHDRLPDRVLGRVAGGDCAGADQHPAASRHHRIYPPRQPRRGPGRLRTASRSAAPGSRPAARAQAGRRQRTEWRAVVPPEGNRLCCLSRQCRPNGRDCGVLTRRGRLLAVFLGIDRGAERRAPSPRQPARHLRYLRPAGLADRARGSGVLGRQIVLCLWARQFDDIPDGARRRIGAVPATASAGRGPGRNAV